MLARSCTHFVLATLVGLVLSNFSLASNSDAASILKNPGFEAMLDAWSLHVYGAQPQVEADKRVLHDGKQSLRISSAKPSDTALGQEIELKANEVYRFSGWVRTRGLDPLGAPVFGTFQIQQAGGSGVIASGVNHGGDTDWTEVSIVFEAPASGKARIAVFFVGFGKGTGAAWFDDLKLEEVEVGKTTIKVTREPLVAGEINPNQYGQFVEYLCDLVPSMWAEKLYDGSFEGLTPYKFYYLKETDFREKPWRPCGATNRAEFSLDSKNPVSGLVAKKIEVKGGTPCTVGIAQDGIAVDREKSCVFSCWLRQQGIGEPIRVLVHHEGREYSACEFKPTGEWKKYRAPLNFTHTDNEATLSITFRGPGTLWLDNVSLMPEKTVGGWRPDVVEAVKALRPGVIRFGGSALDDSNLGEFDWRDTLGDPDKRKPFRAWGGLQPIGPGLEEIVQFCRHVGAEPLLCVRVSNKDAKDAADQVEYFNGAADTPMGKQRAKNGHPEPYRIKYWQIGNERAGADYEARLPAFCKAMKAVDPTVKLLSSYPTAGVLEKAGQWLDFVCPHHYAIADLSGAENDLLAIRDLIHKQAPNRTIKIAVTEWNTTAGDIGPRRAMLWSLDNALACARYHNLLHRHADLVAIANRSNLVNSFCSGIIQTDNYRLYKTPTYYAQRLYATQAGNQALKIDSQLPAPIAPDLSATLSAKGDVVTLFAVNQTLRDVTRPVDLSAFGEQGQEATVWTLADTKHAGEPDVANSFAQPERIASVEGKFKAKSAKFDYSFPALSLTVIRWKVK
ncbi:MAG: alpha-L-arabinofuranosidase C-terminal domain-containing protein [Gemmataceae bacterium]